MRDDDLLDDINNSTSAQAGKYFSSEDIKATISLLYGIFARTSAPVERRYCSSKDILDFFEERRRTDDERKKFFEGLELPIHIAPANPTKMSYFMTLSSVLLLGYGLRKRRMAVQIIALSLYTLCTIIKPIIDSARDRIMSNKFEALLKKDADGTTVLRFGDIAHLMDVLEWDGNSPVYRLKRDSRMFMMWLRGTRRRIDKFDFSLPRLSKAVNISSLDFGNLLNTLLVRGVKHLYIGDLSRLFMETTSVEIVDLAKVYEAFSLGITGKLCLDFRTRNLHKDLTNLFRRRNYASQFEIIGKANMGWEDEYAEKYLAALRECNSDNVTSIKLDHIRLNTFGLSDLSEFRYLQRLQINHKFTEVDTNILPEYVLRTLKNNCQTLMYLSLDYVDSEDLNTRALNLFRGIYKNKITFSKLKTFNILGTDNTEEHFIPRVKWIRQMREVVIRQMPQLEELKCPYIGKRMEAFLRLKRERNEYLDMSIKMRQTLQLSPLGKLFRKEILNEIVNECVISK
jgi:hypothetical protein